jgi:small subunit ribosomal protein S13
MARILGVDLPRNKAMIIAIRSIYGVGPKISKEVLVKAGIEFTKSSNDVSDEDIKQIRQALDDYTLEGDLRRDVAMNIKRLKDLNCYRGIRHKKSLPVRGQRTHTNARTRKGPAVAIAGKKSIKSLKS